MEKETTEAIERAKIMFGNVWIEWLKRYHYDKYRLLIELLKQRNA